MDRTGKCILVSVGVCLLHIGAVPSSAQERSASQQEVWKMEIAFWDSLRAGDLRNHIVL